MPLKDWSYQWGEYRIPITSEMVADALATAISCIIKEYTKTNRVIIEDPRLRSEWEQKGLILDVARNNFLALVEMENKGMVRPRIPGKTPGGKPN